MEIEIEHIEAVSQKLNERQGKMGTNLEAFRKEIIERMGEDWEGPRRPDGDNKWPGFVVTVQVHETDQEGLYWFTIIIDRRTWELPGGTFDPDRQVYDITHDYLGLGEGGVIKSADVLKMSEHQHKHRHGHSH